MPRHISIVFPGQGSQSLGMLNCFSKDILNSYKDSIIKSLGFDLIDIINNGPEEELNRTSITQPAILFTSYLYFERIKKSLNIEPNILSGHSLGEYSSLVAAESLSLDDALLIVHKRGLLMESCEQGSMYAVINVDFEEIKEICSKVEIEMDTIVSPANLNSPNQTVISGTIEGTDAVIEDLKERGYRKCIKLNVSIASHSKVMFPTLNKFKKVLNEINISMPKYEILHNVDSKISLNIDELKEKLLCQLIKPVQWTNIMKNIKKSNGIIIECGPGKVLSGLAKANNIDNVYSTSSETSMDSLNKILWRVWTYLFQALQEVLVKI